MHAFLLRSDRLTVRDNGLHNATVVALCRAVENHPSLRYGHAVVLHDVVLGIEERLVHAGGMKGFEVVGRGRDGVDTSWSGEDQRNTVG